MVAELRMMMVAPAPVVRNGDCVTLDQKFVEGMNFQNSIWPGQFDCILREGAQSIPFGARDYHVRDLDFGLFVLSEKEQLSADHFRNYDLVFCSADDGRNFGVPALAQAAGARLATTLEYTLGTRVRIAWLENNRSLARRSWSILRLLRQEKKRRQFLREMDGIQANGFPAFEFCRQIDPDTLLFLDNRMSPEILASPADMDRRKERLLKGEPLRLVYSGRLEPMKGAHDLVPVAAKLRDHGVAFLLDIYGTGSLRNKIEGEITAFGLSDHVRLREPVDFQSNLVPYLRANGDIFLCCHRQSDPSCTYLESMGCGLAVAGFDNKMWAALCRASEAGWLAKLGDRDGLAGLIARIDKDRSEIFRCCENALGMARRHDFPTESRRRMEHLAGIARGN